jgi:hypothetical protein
MSNNALDPIPESSRGLIKNNRGSNLDQKFDSDDSISFEKDNLIFDEFDANKKDMHIRDT